MTCMLSTDTNTVHVQLVLEKMDKGIPAAASRTSKVDRSQAQYHSWRLIVDDSAPHNSWIMGRVIKDLPDKRGLVRQVKIKTKTSYLYRPVT